MTRSTRMSGASRAVCVAVVSLMGGALAHAQQASTPRPTAPVATTPQPTAPADVPFHRGLAGGPGPVPQGFSVVLVQGDLQAVSGTDDVPPAARKALADMRDFLPYKSYKLLDAAWVLCCSGHGYPRSLGDVVTLLKGPEEREYELTLSASAMDSPRVSVRFLLRDVTPLPPGAKPAKEDDVAVQEAKAKIAELEAQRANLRQKYNADHPTVRRADNELATVRRRLEALERGERTPDGPRARMAGRGVIDTNFSMDVGETVVVGTSRLRSGSRALIALLTAVPPKGITERKE
jgi:hypothetical protein